MKRNVLQSDYWHKRDADWEAFDRIELVVTPRFKTSGMSGDEWRTSVVMKFYFKGEVVHESSAHNMQDAILLLGREILEHTSPIPMGVIKLEETKCDEPGCAKDAVSTYRIKQEFSSRGEKLDSSDVRHKSYRRFCKTHLRRGDCSREDSDDNYEVLEGPGPNESSNVIESPSAFGGVVVLDPES